MKKRSTYVLFSIQRLQIFLLFLGTITALTFQAVTFPAFAASESGPDIIISGDRISLKVSNGELVKILGTISEKADIKIYVSNDINQDPLSAEIDNLPLEKAFKSLLHDYSYSATYKKTDDSWKIISLNVYPKGMRSGKMALLNRSETDSDGAEGGEQKTVLTSKGDDKAFIYDGSVQLTGKSGMFMPGQYSESVKDPRYLLTLKQMEQKELEAYNALNVLQAQLAKTEVQEKRDAMALVLLDNLDAFEALQKANRNQAEALHRIELYINNKKSE